MRYATLEDLQEAIEKENQERPFYNLNRALDPRFYHAIQLARNQDDKNLIIQISEGDAYLSDKDKASLWTVTNPSQVSEILSSAREKALGREVCKNRRKDVDKYGRDNININSLDYYTCAGDDPEIAIDRENNVTRLAYNNYPVYPSSIPLGLTSQVMGINPMSESYPPSIPLINTMEIMGVPYGLTNMTKELVKQIPPGFYM
jgi:hypothetical protein